MDKDLLHIKVVREILSQISLGVYKHGHRLPAERKLCEDFGVSRGTLRLALSDLEKMEVVQIKPQSGVYVQNIAKSGVAKKIMPKYIANVSMAEIVFARKAIELAAIELASQRITKAEIKDLNKCIEGMQANVDNLPEYLRFDIAFHEQIVHSSKNPLLIEVFEAITNYHKYSQVFTSSSESCETDAIKHHLRVIAALTAGDTRKSVSALKRHFDSMLKMNISL